MNNAGNIGFGRRTIMAGILATFTAFVGISTPLPAGAADKVIKVGIMSGEDEDVWRVVAKEAAKHGLKVEAVPFNDYIQPNEALARGDLDANSFQHLPYLENQIKTQGYKIEPVGYTAVWPIGLYSKTFSSIGSLPEGATIGVPNDPANEARALFVLQNEGLIKLTDDAAAMMIAQRIFGQSGTWFRKMRSRAVCVASAETISAGRAV